MGRAKAQMMEDEERGWSSMGEQFVCGACVDDDYLKDFIRDEVVSKNCDFCSVWASSPIAARADDVMEIVANAIYANFSDPVHELPYESAEGGYQGNMEYVNDVVYDVLYPMTPGGERFAEAVVDAIANETTLLCKRHYFSMTEGDVLSLGWEEFTRFVKHERRYFFSHRVSRDEKSEFRRGERIRPSDFLDRLAAIVGEFDLIKELPTSTRFFRARTHPQSDPVGSGATLGTATPELAVWSNRMSPAGVPMFYGALDRQVAIDEVMGTGARGSHDRVTSGAFTPSTPLRILDLTMLPDAPSYFDVERARDRTWLLFLDEFVEQLSKPVIKDRQEHIDYVPTQILTEYFRSMFVDESRIDGIVFPSSLDRTKACCVLFFGNDECINLGSPAGFGVERWLALDLASMKTDAIVKG